MRVAGAAPCARQCWPEHAPAFLAHAVPTCCFVSDANAFPISCSWRPVTTSPYTSLSSSLLRRREAERERHTERQKAQYPYRMEVHYGSVHVVFEIEKCRLSPPHLRSHMREWPSQKFAPRSRSISSYLSILHTSTACKTACKSLFLSLSNII